MNTKKHIRLWITLVGIFVFVGAHAKADTFGSGANSFTIDFVNIGNPGNGNDAAFDNTPPGFSSPFGGVTYDYRMGVTEVPQDWITKATNSGLTNVTAGRWTDIQPAANITWYEAAAFVNWMNTSTGHPAAYDLNWTGADWTMNLWSSGQAWQAGGENLYRHKDAFYFLPSEDEWYKAAFHKNDGVTANYWDYATGSDSIPTAVVNGTGAGTAVYNAVTSSPADVDNNGGLSPYGTRGQNGNVWEWQESALSAPNDSSSEDRAIRGGRFDLPDAILRSSYRGPVDPSYSDDSLGFRVASVPEPSSVILMLGSGWIWLLKRCRKPVR